MSDPGLVRAVLADAGLGGVEAMEPLVGHGGTTSRLHRLRVGTDRLIAKITDDPATIERAFREIRVRRRLRTPLAGLAPRVFADRLVEALDAPDGRARAILVMETVDEPPLDPGVGVDDETLARIARAMGPVWSLPPGHHGLDIPRWGAGTATATSPHRRRAARLRRRAAATLAFHGPRAAGLEHVLQEVVDRFDRLAEGGRGLEPSLIHGDLHLGNIHGGGCASTPVRVLDWQHTSVAPPVVDLARLVLDGAREPNFEASVALAAELPVPATSEALAIAILLAFGGLVTGMLGRPPESLSDVERRTVDRFLANAPARTFLEEALRIEAGRKGDR